MKEKIEGYQAHAVNWIESERGYGQRSDGYSLHLTGEDVELFIEQHGRIEGNAECYSRPDGEKFLVIIDEILYDYLEEQKKNEVFGQRYAFPTQLKPGEVILVKKKHDR